MNINLNSRLVKFLHNHIRHYNHESYWKMRAEVVNPSSQKPKWLRLWYLYRIKRMDAFNNASMGTDLGGGARFASAPVLYHGLNGIIVSHYASIGSNCTIMQQVTIAEGEGQVAPQIGDNCLLGAGCKIIGGVKIGNNVKIGANAVVVKDLPDNCTAVGVPARVIKHDNNNR